MLGPGSITTHLADLGADVIKVEPPSGDYIREMTWPIVEGVSLMHLHVSRGKRSVTLDLRTEEGSLFEHANRAAAALAESFLDDGNRVGLLVYGSGIDGVFPGYGRVQRDRILRALGRAAAGHHFVFESLRNLPTRFFPAQSQIIFVSPLSSDDVRSALPLLRFAASTWAAAASS